MRKLILGLMVLGTVPVFAQQAFDGTWRFKVDSGQFKGTPDKYMLEKGVWRCESCVPKEEVKADGKPQKVVGQPYYDMETVNVISDREIEMHLGRKGKPAGTTKMSVSEDGKTLTTDVNFISEAGKKGQVKVVSERVGEVPASGNKVSGTWQQKKMADASQNVTIVTFKPTADGLSMKDQMGDSYDAKFDGKDYPAKGDPGTTSVALRKIDENTIEETDKRDGKVTAVIRMTVAPDGKTMNFAIDDKLHKQQANWTAEKE